MADSRPISRRRLIAGLSSTTATLAVAGFAPLDQLTVTPWWLQVIDSDNNINEAVQRFLVSPRSLAKEFPAADISTDFRANGTTNPQTAEYLALKENGFADWRLVVSGLIETPMEFSLAELRAMPARTQITRHDCVEGWSCIGKWTGVQLGHVLDRVQIKARARYVVFHCFDNLGETLDGSGVYYESVDLEDAYHPQTILAYAMNDAPLTVPYGAPLRVRVERQLGYKMAKYIRKIDVVARLPGNGGFWEDRGYDWYAGI